MMNRGHISQAVESLCRRRYIVAIPDKDDRRYVHYELLNSAQKIVEDMKKMREDMNEKILEGISEKELDIFKNVSMKIKNNIEKML